MTNAQTVKEIVKGLAKDINPTRGAAAVWGFVGVVTAVGTFLVLFGIFPALSHAPTAFNRAYWTFIIAAVVASFSLKKSELMARAAENLFEITGNCEVTDDTREAITQAATERMEEYFQHLLELKAKYEAATETHRKKVIRACINRDRRTFDRYRSSLQQYGIKIRSYRKRVKSSR